MWDDMLVTAAQIQTGKESNKKALPEKEAEMKPKKKAQMADREYNPIREKIAKEELDNLSILLGDRFPLSSKFNKAMRNDNSPLTVNVIKKNSVPFPRRQTKYAAGKAAFELAYGGNTSVHLGKLNIDADLTYDAVSEALSKYDDYKSIREILDLIPILKDQFNNGYCFSVERVHLKNKKKAMFGFRVYNLYWEKQNNGTEIPKILVGTVVQNYDKGSYVHTFQDIKSVTASPGTSMFGSSITTSGDIVNVSQLYSVVKKISRFDGGLKYDPIRDQDKLFRYTERNDGVKYSARDIPAPYDTMSYADIQQEIRNVSSRQRDLSVRKAAISDDERYTDAAMRLSESFDEMKILRRKNHAGTITQEERERMNALQDERDKLRETIKQMQTGSFRIFNITIRPERYVSRARLQRSILSETTPRG